jgi:predicted RND superfamily exporter protein
MGAGLVLMLTGAWLLGLRVNFLDFVALPITIGIGIDYAANLAARDRHDGNLGSRELLASTGSAVLLCSFTTMVGYGSLLLSLNQGIRSFGAAAILGEATCLGAALLFAPALLRARRRTPSTTAIA